MAELKVENVEKLDDGQIRITDSEGDQHEGAPSSLPDELTAQLAEGYMRQSDYTKKTQELSEIKSEVEELKEQFSQGFQNGPQQGAQTGSMDGGAGPNAPGGSQFQPASPSATQQGQPTGTTGQETQPASSPSFNFTSIPANAFGNGDNEQQQQVINRLAQNQQKLQQQLQQQRAKEAKRDAIDSLRSQHGSIDEERINQEINNMTNQKLQGMSPEAAVELAYYRTKNTGSGSDDASQPQPQASQPNTPQNDTQEGQAPSNDTPYANSGNTSGPSVTPQAQGVAQSDDEISQYIEQTGLGNRSEEQAKNNASQL